MNIFGLNITFGKGKTVDATPASSGSNKSRSSWQSPWMTAITEVPNTQPYRLYKLIRDCVPCVDMALGHTARLCGTLDVVADEPLKTDLGTFIKEVPVNYLHKGMTSLLREHVRQMLTFGPAVIELVPNNSGDDVYRLINVESETIVFKPIIGNMLGVQVCQRQQGQALPVELDANWIVVNANDAGANPNGRSILASLPFVTETLLKMEEAMSQNWDRFGVPSFHVNWEPPENFSDPKGEKSTAVLNAIENSFSKSMESRKSGEVKDFFSSGKVKVEVVGADGQMLEFVEDARALMEQIAGKTGLPAWMLGFTWSSTERLSQQQADVLIAYIGAIQDELTSTATWIVQRWMDLTGRTGEFKLKWTSVSLQDALSTAQADNTQAAADKTKEATAVQLWRNGVFTQEQYAEYILGDRFDGNLSEQKDPPAAAAPPPQAIPGQDPIGEPDAPPEPAPGDQVLPEDAKANVQAVKNAKKGKGAKNVPFMRKSITY